MLTELTNQKQNMTLTYQKKKQRKRITSLQSEIQPVLLTGFYYGYTMALEPLKTFTDNRKSNKWKLIKGINHSPPFIMLQKSLGIINASQQFKNHKCFQHLKSRKQQDKEVCTFQVLSAMLLDDPSQTKLPYLNKVPIVWLTDRK